MGHVSLLATDAQMALHTLMPLSPGWAIANPFVGGLIPAAAGAYRFTPIKSACLVQCQSPLDFLSTHRREGVGEPLRIGLRRGPYCVGCR